MRFDVVAAFREELRLCEALYPQTQRWTLALSGGVDSTALLYLSVACLPLARLRAVHIDHQLQPESGQWADHCAQLCSELGVEFQRIAVTPGSSSENSARQARYQAFESILTPQDTLLLGQQADDQAETLLFRLFRGSGVRGLAGIPKARSLGCSQLYRPLLNVSREQLTRYLTEQKVRWIDDPSNARTDYTRNWIRHRLAPVIAERWPAWRRVLGETQGRMCEADRLNQDLARLDLAEAFDHRSLPLECIRSLPDYRIKNALIHWLMSRGVAIASQAQLEDLVQGLSRGLTSGDWLFGDQTLSLFDGRLYLRSGGSVVLHPGVLRVSEQDLDLEVGHLSWRRAESGFPAGLELEFRSRQPGDRVQIHGRGSVTLKKLMNEQRIAPWLRDTWPVLIRQRSIVAVPGLWIDQTQCVSGGYRPTWHQDHLSQP